MKEPGNHPMQEPVSREHLNAFVDGELAAGEWEQSVARLEADPEFKAQVCEARILKELLRGAYAELPGGPMRRRFAPFRSGLYQSLAAGLLLALGMGAGWFANERFSPTPGYHRLADLPPEYQPVSLAGRVDPNKVILHLDSSDPQRLAAVLDLAERMLAKRGEAGRVEVVVNSYGLNLLRADTTPYGERIGQLTERHPNLAFVACGQTMARLKREGVHVSLVPEAHVSSSAINEILTRMRQGWVYVKV